MKEGLKLVLLFDRAGEKKKNPKKHFHTVFFFIWAALHLTARRPQINGMVMLSNSSSRRQQSGQRRVTFSRARSDGLISIAFLSHPQDVDRYLLPVRNVQITWNISDATLRQKYEILSKSSQKLYSCTSISSVLVHHPK